MSAYTELKKHFFKNIVNSAKELNYSEENILILENNLELLISKYPDTYKTILTCKHNMDKRTPIEYAQDLVASWVFEDTLLNLLKENNICICLNGADKNRKILSTSDVTTASDTMLQFNDKNIPLEIMCDYTNYWYNNKKIDLRDNKYIKLVNEKSVFLGISIKTTSYILLDFSKPIEHTYINSYAPYGGKPCYSISIINQKLKPFTIDNFINDMNNIIKKR